MSHSFIMPNENLLQSFKGEGRDVSKKKILNCLNAKHHYISPNNFYSLRECSNYESLDFIYSKNLINTSKFHRILISEWFKFCKLGGKIIIEIQPNKLLNFDELIKECKLLLKNKINILFMEKNILVLEKKKNYLKKKDSINCWSFGIITDGQREDWLENEINSIISLKIPHFEILICGPYNGEKRNVVKIVQFKSDKPLICAKKNLICKNAKYENICITHNKFIFNKNWYTGMKKYGNYFEILSCKIQDHDRTRAGDWITYGSKWDKISKIGLMNYMDWDKYGYLDGGLYILKKSVWKSVPWNSKLLWGEGEDLDISRRFYENGYVSRINIFSICNTLKWNHGKFKLFEFNNQKLGKIKHSCNYPIWYLKQLIKKYLLRRKING